MSVNVHSLSAGECTQEEFGHSLTGSGVECDGAGTWKVPFNGARLNLLGGSGQPAQLSRRFAVATSMSVEDWLGAADDESFICTWGLFDVFAVDATTGYKIRIKELGTTKVTGSTIFSYGDANQYDMRLDADGSTFVIEYGSEEQSFASTLKPTLGAGTTISFRTTDKSQATKYLRVRKQLTCSGDDHNDRPSKTLNTGVHYPITGTPMDDSYSVSGCTNKYQCVDEWQSGDVDASDFNQSPATANTTFRQTHVSQNATVTNVRAVRISATMALNIADKDATTYIVSADGTNRKDVVTSTLTEVATIQRAIYDKAPDGGAWTQADVDNLQLGTRVDVAADAVALQVLVIQAESIGFALDAAPAPTGQPERGTMRGVRRGVGRGVS